MEQMPIKSCEEILNTYWPVIEKAIEVQAYYNGRAIGQDAKIAPNVTGELIEALVKARVACPVKREEV